MEITINGEERVFEASSLTVEELLERLEIEQTEGVAVAVGDRVVVRSKWGEAEVEDGARVEIIRATQGG